MLSQCSSAAKVIVFPLSEKSNQRKETKRKQA